MKLERASPIAALRECVRCFEQREAYIAGAAVVYPVAARPEQFLEFYLQERYLVRDRQSGAQELAPSAVVVGPRTCRRAELLLGGDLQVFTIHFQASGFYRLFRVPANGLVDRAYDARSVIGPLAAEIEQKLADASCFKERIRVADNFLMQQLREPDSADTIASAANRFYLKHGSLRVDDAAASAGLSIRQFERRFIEQVGLPPKQYARIVRFSAALEAKVIAPRRLWTDIAHEFGYFDQMHMVRDFDRFAGESPTAFIRRLGAMSEPWA